LIIVHDGARPFITTELLDKGIAAALENGAAIAAVPVKDTIKQSDDSNVIERTLPRDRLWAVQTPQVFNAALLKEAHEKVHETVTDDSSMIEAIGHPVKVFPGSYYNIKVTTPEDLTIARAIISENAAATEQDVQ
jgi:2-C-methyl-D-erythritol 4-phosphate cytidylyltransferase